MRRALALVTLALALTAPAPTALADGLDPDEWGLRLAADAAPAFTGPEGAVTLLEHAPGERAAWALNLTAEYTVLEVRVEDAFDVERPRQVVPYLDGEHFTPVGFDVSEVEDPVRVLNVRGDADAFTYRLGLPGPGERNLTLLVDAEPPGFVLGPFERVTHYSFYVETETTEAALATLFVTPAAGGDEVEHPTPTPAGLQRFPVQGLQADRGYSVRFAFEDWSGNVAETGPFTVTTTPEPRVPTPELTVFQPLGGEFAPHEAPVIRVTIESPGAPILEGGLRFFFDKTEVRGNWTIKDGVLEYEPGPLAPGFHSFSVEAVNAEGGRAHVTGNFTITTNATPALAFPVIVSVVAALALGRVTRRARR